MRGYKVAIVLVLAVLVGVVLLFFYGPKAPVVAKSTLKPKEKIEYADHTEAFKKAGITAYQGAASCVDCHEEATEEAFHSNHYQMENVVRDVLGKGAVPAGGKLAYNDFCGAIFWKGKVNVNYIGKALLKAPPPEHADLKGSFIATGCSMCHGNSMGLIPKLEPTEEQLANVDCLSCHADPKVYPAGAKGVKTGAKEVYKDENGTWRYRVKVPLEKLAKAIVKTPPKDQCLLCHAFSGGGPGFKRPNLEPALLGEVKEEIDVHLARGMNCTDCHVFKEHQLALKSPDTWARSAKAKAPACADCHEQRHTRPVLGWVLETFHKDKVACQTCHIPRYAKAIPTDTHRDWSKAEFSVKMKRWEPEIRFGQNLTPVYRFWNEKTRVAYLYPEPAEVKEGKIVYAAPVSKGAKRAGLFYKTDGKVYPFKYHEAVVPFDPEKKVPVPVKVGLVFATGDTKKAAQVGAKLAGLNFTGDYVTLVRYMSVNHGVEPAKNALFCLDCHGPTLRRMPWHELGYGHYPEIAFTLAVLVGLVALLVLLYLLFKR